MKQIKRVYCIAVLLLMIIPVLCGCSKSSKGDLTADTYMTMAQDFLDEGKTDEAIAVLESGIKETGDTGLIALLSEIKGESTNSEESGNVGGSLDYTEYVGGWEEDIEPNSGGVYVGIELDGDEVDVY